MLRNTAVGVLAVAVLGMAATAQAQISQSVSFNVGVFAVRGEDARPTDDVLVQNAGFLTLNVGDFSGATVDGDWLIGLGDYIEGGVGIGYYRHTVTTVYRAFVNEDGTEIPQDLRLRIAPLTFTARFLPFGRHAAVVPYAGAGVAVYSWRYSETGEFVDFTDNSIFHGSYADSGTEVGPVFLVGARVPVGDVFAVGGEMRYQKGIATLDPAQGFAGTKLDLGGYATRFTFQIRF
jgi:outer membrane protein W